MLDFSIIVEINLLLFNNHPRQQITYIPRNNNNNNNYHCSFLNSFQT